jgi:hypothetical protein
MIAAALTDFRPGDRVELHPGTDRWLMGDRFGIVERIGREHVHVALDKSGRVIAFHPLNLILIEGVEPSHRVPTNPITEAATLRR